MDLYERIELNRRKELPHLQRRQRQRNEKRRKQSNAGSNETSCIAGSDRERSILSPAAGEYPHPLRPLNTCDPLRGTEEPSQRWSNHDSCFVGNDAAEGGRSGRNVNCAPASSWRPPTDWRDKQCTRSRCRRKVMAYRSPLTIPRWRQALITGAIFLLAVLLPAAIAGSPKYETAYACEGKTLMIECEPGDLINLIRANYGRFSITICNDHGNVDWSVNCMSPKSLRVLHSKCAQKQNCSVLASTSMFGDPCPGTHKYLEAHYQCVSAAQSSTTTNRPSPPWLKTSQPIVWSTSTVRSPVLSRLNLTTDLGGGGGEVAVVAAVTPALSTPAVTLRPGASAGNVGTKTSQSPTTFRNKGFENKSVNDDLAIIKTITDRKKGGDPVEPLGPRTPYGGVEAGAAGTSGGGGLQKEEDDDDGADLFPTQTAVLSGAAAPPGVRKLDPAGTPTSVNGGGSVQIDISHACGPSTARNLFWNVTRVGEVNVQPCPGGATGIAKWRCVAVASLTPEQRVHLQQEHQQMLQIQAAQQQSAGGAGGVNAPSADDSGSHGDISFSSNSVALSDKQSMVGAATWYAYRPDLTQCRSLWLNNLEVRVQQPDSSLISIANDLAQVTSSKTLYGGDMLVATKIIQTMSQKMHYDIETIPDQRQREALVFELLNSVVKTGSNLLDQSQHASWLDLSVEDQMRVATSLLTGLEDNAFLLADTILREKHVVQKVKNILLSIRVLETRNFGKSTELFPDSSTERWQVSSDQIELPKAALIENSEGGLVRIVFVAFDRLEQILRPQFSNIQQQQHGSGGAGPSSGRVEPSQHRHLDTDGIASANVAGLGANDGTFGSSAGGGASTRSTDAGSPSDAGVTVVPRLRLLNSKVISASLGKGRHIQLSQPIRMVLRHLRTKNVSNPTCVFWNYIDHAWSEDGCHVEYTNSTHTVCMCNHLTNFALLVDAVDNETQLSLLSHLDDSLLLYIGIAVLVAVVVIALFARKLCYSSVLAKLRNGGPEAGAAGLRGGPIDRDPAGLSISAHHGTVAGRLHHHHHGGSNNAGVDLHHPTVATAGHHHHHMVHHHLPPPGTGHHLLVADDFHHQQQQSQQPHPANNNLHNHHPNNLAGGGNHHHVNSNNLVTTTFNNLNGGGGIGGGNCSPSPPGSGYDHHHPGHHLARLNNNVNVNFPSNISSSSNNSTNNSAAAAAALLLTGAGKGGDDALAKPFPSYRTNNNQINLLRAANHHAQQQQQQQHQQQQQQQHQQHQQPAPSANAPSAAVLLQQQQHHHRHHLHHQPQAAAATAGTILLQGFGGDGGPSSPSASSLIASTSLITTIAQPTSQQTSPAGRGRGGGGGSMDSSGSDRSSSGSTTAAEMVAYNLSGEIGDGGAGMANGAGSPGNQLHLHHHQGSIGSSASSGLLVVAAGGGNAGGSVSVGTAGTITSSASSSASASVPLLHHHHHHHLHHHLHQHLHPGGSVSPPSDHSSVPIPSKRNL
ncbi:AGAP003972-PA [Anopheles gambiae str. PEST]|uniref:AGAP003972-PA n=1 Tax=Anopheles gambiae TaxID=7165 RepID=Q7PML6_ANOGA|nr:AGAP003972-PA [Anopheles gambiae str. PEST]